jgi:cysteine desulfurase
MKPDLIYLDAHASTPLAPEALDALVLHLGYPGNPHSPHAAGARAHEAVEDARCAVADLIGAAPAEIVFTSGATEANNLAILGLARAALGGTSRRTIVTSAIEHPSVLEAAEALAGEGFNHHIAPVDTEGRIDLAALAKILSANETLLVSVMAANNVTGVIQPVGEVAALARSAGAIVHCDAAQAAGRIALDVFDLDVDALSLSAHKMYGPPGVGALYLSAACPVRLKPLTFGGGQERGLRSGTTPAALVASFGAAASLVGARRDIDDQYVRRLAARFLARLQAHQVRLQTIGSDQHRLPGSVNIAIENYDAQELTERLSSTVAISTGSACSSGQINVSPVLEAMRLPDALSRSSFRVCFNRYSTEEDADLAATTIVGTLREMELATGRIVQ